MTNICMRRRFVIVIINSLWPDPFWDVFSRLQIIKYFSHNRASKSPDLAGDLPIFDKIMKISRSPDLE